MKTCCIRSAFCDLVMNNSVGDCPCLDCLVKVICTEICDDLNNYYRSVFNFDHEEMGWKKDLV